MKQLADAVYAYGIPALVLVGILVAWALFACAAAGRAIAAAMTGHREDADTASRIEAKVNAIARKVGASE